MTAVARKQPYEGINGTARTGDDLLSLEDEAIAVRKVLVNLMTVIRKTTLVGQPAPIVRDISDRMGHPVPGDLVVEASTTLHRQTGDWYRGFGILLEHRREWWETDADWEVMVAQGRADHEEFLRGPYAHPGDADEPWEPDERRTDDAWYVQYGPGERDICRWVNCEFMMVPTDAHEVDRPVGTRDGNGVTFTRDDLLGALADSGFQLRPPAGPGPA